MKIRYSNTEANGLFEEVTSKSPSDVIRKLHFLWKWGLGEVFEYDSDQNHAWYLLGLAYEKRGERAMAATCFLNAFFAYPKDIEALVAYTNTQENLEKQVCEIESILAVSEDWRIRFNLANAYIDLGQKEKALRHLERINSKHADTDKINRAILELGGN